MEIRGFTVRYYKNQAKQGISMESLLQKQINELSKKAETHPNNKQIINEIHIARSCLKNIMQYKTKGTIQLDGMNMENVKPSYFNSLEN